MGTFHVPLNGIHSTVSHRRHHAVVIIPVGWPEQIGTNAGDGFDLVVAGVQLRLDLIGAEFGKIGVVVGMVHDFMTGIMQRFHRLGKFVHPLANHKKGGFDVVFPQNVDQLLGIFVPPG